jgi:tight adherence protein B
VGGVVNGWVVAFLVGGIVVVVWPIGMARRRWTMRSAPGPGQASRAAPASWRVLASGRDLRGAAVTHPRRSLVVIAVIGGVGGLAAGGPVAALALGVYAGLAARAVVRHWSARDRAAARSRALDEVGALAADLRAGLPADVREFDDPRLQELTDAAGHLAERTGAPVADLVDRIEADARAGDRAQASVAAQAAGARATAMLLAGLPAGGIALGYAIGADPLRVLLHTPLGAACVAGSLILQIGGLAWADRLAGAGTRR